MTTNTFKYADLFAGVGGFAATLSAMGGEHAYAVEIDPAAAAVYTRNWGHNPLGDVTKDATETVMRVPLSSPTSLVTLDGAEDGLRVGGDLGLEGELLAVDLDGR